MNNPILALHNISKNFGALKASRDISLSLIPGEIHALIGANGAGKSTLIKQISGELQPDQGQIHLSGRNITKLDMVARARLGLGRSFQISSLMLEHSPLENIALVLLQRYTGVYNIFSRWSKQAALKQEALGYLEQVNLAEHANKTVQTLAHGQRRRLEVAMALALQPKLFLFDEPMAGLGAEGSGEMTKLLNKLRNEAPILLVEHDMDAVFALADRISVLNYGQIIASGTPAQIREDALVQLAYLGEDLPDEPA